MHKQYPQLCPTLSQFHSFSCRNNICDSVVPFDITTMYNIYVNVFFLFFYTGVVVCNQGNTSIYIWEVNSVSNNGDETTDICKWGCRIPPYRLPLDSGSNSTMAVHHHLLHHCSLDFLLMFHCKMVVVITADLQVDDID